MPDGTNGGRAEIRSILGMAAMRRAPEGIHCAAGCAASSAMSRYDRPRKDTRDTVHAPVSRAVSAHAVDRIGVMDEGEIST